MTRYTLTTAEKNNVQEITTLELDEHSITHTVHWRWGSWFTDSDTAPPVDLDNPHGFNISLSDTDWQLVETSDGHSTWQFPEDFDPELASNIQDAYQEDLWDGVESLGCELLDTDMILHGPLVLEAEPSPAQ
jgi:hypothetical protein